MSAGRALKALLIAAFGLIVFEPAPTICSDKDPMVFKSIEDIFNDFPTELRPPKAGKWDKFTKDKATAWLKQHVVGSKLHTKLKVRSVKVGGTVDTSKKAEFPWQVTIDVEGNAARVGPVRFDLQLWEGSYGGFKVYGDEAFARRAESIKKGHLIEVSGTIAGMTLLGDGGKYIAYLSISDAEVNSWHLKRD